MIVDNHHAREWMSYQVPMMQLEVITFSYKNIGYTNGDGRVDEDTWGDSNGDGQLDDGDCLALAAEHQDSNGDGTPVDQATSVWTRTTPNSGSPTS